MLALSKNASVDDVTLAKLWATMSAYHSLYADDGYLTKSAEEVFHLPIFHPSTGNQHPIFTHAGKYDGIVEKDGKVYILEHKTSSEDIESGGNYWERLKIDSQIGGYWLSQYLCGVSVEGVLYDVLKKPTIRPKSLTKAAAKEIATQGIYLGEPVSQDTRNGVSSEIIDSENGELYGIRLRNDMHENPSKYFARRVITRMESELVEHAFELWDTANDVYRARNNGAHYRNSTQCTSYGSKCEYFSLCCGEDTLDSGNWRRKEKRHEELGLDGLDILSNSRLCVFRSCRRKHFYRYEEGVQRIGWERDENLEYGSLIHELLEVWWKERMVSDGDGEGEDVLPERPSGERGETPAAGGDLWNGWSWEDEPGCEHPG